MGRRAHIVFSIVGLALSGFVVVQRYELYLLERADGRTHFAPFDLMMPFLFGLMILQLCKLLMSPKATHILDPHATVRVEDWIALRGLRLFYAVVIVGIGVLGLTGYAGFDRYSLNPPLSIFMIGAGAYGAAALLLAPRLRVVLSPRGIEYSLVRPALIAWEDVTGVELKTYFLNSTILLNLKEAKDFRSAKLFSRWHRLSRFQFFPIRLGLDPETLFKGIELRRNVFTF